MKHLEVLLLLLCSLTVHAAGQRHMTIELTYSPEDFIVQENKGFLTIDSYRYPVQYAKDSTASAMPWIPIHVLIGSGEEYVSEEVSYQDTNYAKDVQVRINSTTPLQNEDSRSTPCTPQQPYSKNKYPSQDIRYTGTHHVDGYTYISFLVCPFAFLPQEKVLRLHEKITLNIQLAQKRSSNVRIGRAMRNAIKNIVINKDEMNTLYPEPKRVNLRAGLTADDDFDYLIITRDSLKDSFQKLADWKTRKGVPTRILTMEYIDSAYYEEDFFGQAHLPLLVKKAINDYYENHHIKYVLLGGDYWIVPSEQCHLQYKNITQSITQVTSDLYYACLNAPLDWDKYHHNYISAEYTDYIDCHPAIPVSRLSVCSNSDAEIQINRIINYEREPNIELWNDSVLLSGCAYDSEFNYFDRSDVEYKGRTHLSPAINSFGEDRCFHFYDTGTDCFEGAAYDVTAIHFKEQFEKGYSFVQFDGHGGHSCFVLEHGDSLSIQDAASVVNPRHTIIVTSACSTNYFEGDCLSEAFMRNPHSGVIAYWGGSDRVVVEEDLWDDQSHLSVFDHMNLNIYEHLMSDEENHLGDAINEARLNIISTPSGNIPYDYIERDILLNTNLLGDPEMRIYTHVPMEFDGLDIAFRDDGRLMFGFASSNQFFNNYDLCVMSIDDNGESLYSILTEIDNEGAILDLPAGHDYSICATQPGFKPFIVNVYRRGFVQNDTIANESIVWSDGAMIGSDVTTAKPQGHVFVEKEQMTIKAPHGVTIKNNFTLKKGATLVIDPTIQHIYHQAEEQ